MERAVQLIRSCGCGPDTGCPACVQHMHCNEYNAVLSKVPPTTSGGAFIRMNGFPPHPSDVLKSVKGTDLYQKSINAHIYQSPTASNVSEPDFVDNIVYKNRLTQM